MTITVILKDFSNDFTDSVVINSVEDIKHFKYIDNESCICEMFVYGNGILFKRIGNDHNLELDLYKDNCAKITTPEGIIKLDVKIVDFIQNDDILVMRYKIDDVEREIRILYRS